IDYVAVLHLSEGHGLSQERQNALRRARRAKACLCVTDESCKRRLGSKTRGFSGDSTCSFNLRVKPSPSKEPTGRSHQRAIIRIARERAHVEVQRLTLEADFNNGSSQ